jgi:hypothetical protein
MTTSHRNGLYFKFYFFILDEDQKSSGSQKFPQNCQTNSITFQKNIYTTKATAKWPIT